jgi:hypothetical protein
MEGSAMTVDLRLSTNAKWAIRWVLLPLGMLTGSMAVARAYDTTWIASGLPLSATKLKADLDEAQARIAALEGRSVPSGAIEYFNLTTCPAGWSDVSTTHGRYLVGLTPGQGTLGATVGTALRDQENRPVGQHTHAVNDPGHTHDIQRSNMQAPAGGTGGIFGLQENSGTTIVVTQGAMTGITVANSGSIASTNAPYVQFLVCSKD